MAKKSHPPTPFSRRFSTWARVLVKPIAPYWTWIIIGTAVVAYLLGLMGLEQYYAVLKQPTTFFDLAYQSFQLFVLQFNASQPESIPITLEIARFLAPGVAAYAAIVALVRLLSRELESQRLLRARNHVIIAGLGRKGWLLAKGYKEQGRFVVVIERNPECEFIPACRNMGIPVLVGNAAEQNLLAAAGVPQATLLFAVTGNDAINAEVSVRARQVVRKSTQPITCIVHIVDPQLIVLLKPKEFDDQEQDLFRLSLFNLYEWGAQAMLDESRLFEIHNQMPRVLVIGAGQLGESLIAQMARRWTNQHSKPEGELAVVLIDLEARERIEWLRARYPKFDDNIALSYLAMDVRSAEFERAAFLFDADKQPTFTHIFICLDQDALGLATALSLQHRLAHFPVEISLRLSQQVGLGSLLPAHVESSRAAPSAHIHAFPLYEVTCQPDRLLGTSLELIARSLHAYWRQKQIEQNKRDDALLIPPQAPLPEWADLDEDFRESSRLEADHIGVMLHSVECDIGPWLYSERPRFAFREDEVAKLAKEEHERWYAERDDQGWEWGVEYIKAEKKNPRLVHWEQLEPKTQENNREFVRAIPELLHNAGLEVYRRERE